ncbi:MAG TPA: AI-2E family transporter [Steroidobacteraceae bacterium]|nr:AI-2E family transporter [Steroidobacteraceae bacterium]
MNAEAETPALRDRAAAIIATGTVLAILYFARDVLVPVTLAVMLSLLLAPVVRTLRRVGLGAISSVVAVVLLVTLACAAVASVIGVQLARVAKSLPQYEETIRGKFEKLNELTLERLAEFTAQTDRIAAPKDMGADRVTGATSALPALEPLPTTAFPASALAPGAPAQVAPIPVELHAPQLSPLQLIERVLAKVWVPLESAGIVLIVLIFVLLERESVRDRFIRIAGGSDVRATTLVLNDAGERLSRFFVSQFAVNLGVGVAVWVGLALIGLPHPTLWAVLAALLRFVPYIGIWIAALLSAALAAAIDPGWVLALMTLGLFVIVELLVSQLVEPQLYGHTTGLSPLSVVVAAIFWSWLWGPIGLVVSTPLTLCLVVAGRHFKALSLLDVMLGSGQALTMSERFYQRALSADSDELIASARGFLKHHSLAEYGDFVLLPAMRLAMFDLERGRITREQQLRMRRTVVDTIQGLDGKPRLFARRRDAISVLDHVSIGRALRQQREQLTGRWQGPLNAPVGSVILCVSMGAMPDDLAAEILVRSLRDEKLDARHLSVEDLRQPPPDASPASIFMVYLVSASPGKEREQAESVAEQVRHRLPNASLVTLFMPGLVLPAEPAIDTIRGADKAASSLEEALQICLDWLQERTKS